MDVPNGLTRDVGAVLSAVEQVPIIFMCLEGPDLRWAVTNASTRDLIGDQLGQPVAEILAQMVGQGVMDRIIEVYTSGNPFVATEWRLEFPEPDGGRREVFVSFTYVPWRNPDGSMRGIICFGQDVTEDIRARRASEGVTAELRAQYEPAQATVAALQGALLPDRLPVLAGLDLSARYLLAESDTAAGGDWFDTVVLDDGRIGLMVGDVVGHGVQASAVMGQLRAALAGYLLEGVDPAAAVTRLERFADRVPGAAAATVCAVVIDPDTGEVTYCTAGHPPPLIASTIGQARYVEPSCGSPLGAPGGYTLGQDRLELDEVLLLYTDGIIERPLRSPSQATVELLQAAADAAAGRTFVAAPQSPAERVTDQVLELLTRTTGHSDDITLFAAHRRTPVTAFHRTGRANVGTVAGWREEFETWLRDLSPQTVVLVGAVGAAMELTANVVEHAYDSDDGTGELSLSAELTSGGDLVISVRDHGRWDDTPPAAGRGRGLSLAGALTDELTVERSSSGTTVTTRLALTKSARLAAGQAAPAQAPPFDTAVDGQTMLVSGPLDISTAREFDQRLRETAQHASNPLTIDLSGVTHLASAGVQVLAAALHRVESNNHQLVLIAAPGCPAQHVLALTNLPYTPTSPEDLNT